MNNIEKTNLKSTNTNINPIILTSKKHILLQNIGVILLIFFGFIILYNIMLVITPNNTSNNVNSSSNNNVNNASKTIITNSNLPASDNIDINNIYNNPTDPILTSFEADNDNSCTPQYGKDRKQLYTAIMNIHSDYIKNNYNPDNIQEIKNLPLNESVTLPTINNNYPEPVTFTRINDNYPERYQLNKYRVCPNRPYRSTTDVNNRWTTITGCTQLLTDTILSTLNSSSYDTLQYLDNQSDVDVVFNPYKLDNMLGNNTPDYDKRKVCYGNDGYLTITNSNRGLYTPGNVLGPGFRFVRDITGGVIILRSGNYTFSILENGDLYINGPNGHSYRVNPSNSVQSNSVQSLTMQHDGNFVIKNTEGNIIYNTNIGNFSGAYLELEDTGELYIKNSSGTIIHYVRSRIRAHLLTAFYDNSPNIVFSDKKGRFFPFTWSSNGNQTKDGILYEDNINDNDNCSGSNVFRGWCVSDSNTEWNVRELNLLDFNYYKQKTEGDDNKPNKNDPAYLGSDNYNRSWDITYFYNHGGNKPGNTGVKIRKPLSIRGGISKSNYLPGYLRVSYVDSNLYTYKFLVMARGGSLYNQAFVLYKKHSLRDDFAKDIIENHPQIIEKLKEYYRNH